MLEADSDGLCTTKATDKMPAMENPTAAPSTNISTQVLQILKQVWADKTMHSRINCSYVASS